MSDGQVQLFIDIFRKLCETGNVYLAKDRTKNKEFLEKIGWLPEDVINYLYENLSIEHYYSGPANEIDKRHKPGVIYVFLVPLEEHLVYVKIKKFEGELQAIVISFHEEGRWYHD